MRRQVTRIHLIVDDDAWVLAQFPVELSLANIDRMDARGAAL